MENQTWLESSLRRSSQLGREVFIKARRRSADWWRIREFSSHEEQTREENTADHPSLDHAFAKIVEYMSETTKQCKMFYGSTSAADLSQQEQSHVCRFHSQQSPHLLGKTRDTASSRRVHHDGNLAHRDLGCCESEDFFIDVSPGTYAQTKMVHFK